LFFARFFLLYRTVLLRDCVLWVEYELFISSLEISPVVFLILLDYISVSFMGVVCLISGVVLIYRTSYIQSDNIKTNFMKLVFMFVLSILLMVIRPNLISILLGWDGLGLVSYMLVIYFQAPKSYSAGMITFLSNRVGDLLLLLAIR